MIDCEQQVSGTIVLGIGNPLGGDDAVGTLVVDIINQMLGTPGDGRHSVEGPMLDRITAIDTSAVPENYTSVIHRYRPDLLILVDAADMGLPAGTARIIPAERIKALSFSTHHMPLSMFISYVREFCGKVLLVGIQPKQTETGAPISEVVSKNARKLARTILEGRLCEIQPLQ
jgi:hydrogenase 3 maturation protease